MWKEGPQSPSFQSAEDKKMQTLFWSAFGLVGVVILLLIAILVVLTLSRDPVGKREGSRKNGQEKSKTSSPADNSITGMIKKAMKDSGYWNKVVGVAAAMIVVFMIIYLFDWMLPKLSEAYQLRGGPHYVLVLAAAVIALLGLIWPGKTRTTLLTLMGVLVGGAILTALLPAIWEVGFPSSPVQTARTVQTVRQTSSDQCDNLYKPYTVYPTPSVITGAVGCFVGVKVRSTAPVILIGERGEESAPIYNDSPDQVLNFRVVEWKTIPGQVAQVQARLFRQ